MKESFELLEATQAMANIRAFEQTLLNLFKKGLLSGSTHTSIGQEANAVGVAAAINRDDVVVSNHRCHGHFLAHDGNMTSLFAEIMGLEGGVCGGWGGSQHLCIPKRFYSNGIQGGILPLGLGLALAMKMNEDHRLVTVFIGDGTLGQGAVYECLNMAAIYKVPLLVVIEDNGIAQSTPTKNTMAGSIVDRILAFGLRCESLEYPDARQVFEIASELCSSVRKGKPAVLVLRSARLGPHSKGDDTRPLNEIEELKKLDPLMRMIQQLPAGADHRIFSQAEQLIEGALLKAQKYSEAKYIPIQKTKSLNAHSHPVADDPDSIAIARSLSGISFLEQINRALHDVMAENHSTLLLGEDLLDPYGGAFKASSGLSSKYPGRVIATPISEESFVGLCGGLALEGKKPIVEIMFGDFLAVAANQILNHLALYRGMYNQQVDVPVVIRAPMGGGRGYGPTHSQSLEKIFAGQSGLKIFAPSFMHPYKYLLEMALNSPDPTLMVENKISYPLRPEVDAEGLISDLFCHYHIEEDDIILTLSPSAFEDDDFNVVCYGGMVPLAINAAQQLMLDHEISIRIIAPSCIHPLNVENLADKLVANKPLIAIEEAMSAFGFAAELIAQLAEKDISPKAFRRIGAENCVIGAGRNLEKFILPSVETIISTVLELKGE